MQHKAIVCVTQLIALLMGIGISIGIVSLTDRVGCIGGGYGFCFLDTLIVMGMGAIAFISFAFAALLFKAYSIK